MTKSEELIKTLRGEAVYIDMCYCHCSKTSAPVLRKAAAALESMNPWISVDDHDPPYDTELLVAWAGSDVVELDSFTNDRLLGFDYWVNNSTFPPTHFLIPPPIPKEESL